MCDYSTARRLHPCENLVAGSEKSSRPVGRRRRENAIQNTEELDDDRDDEVNVVIVTTVLKRLAKPSARKGTRESKTHQERCAALVYKRLKNLKMDSGKEKKLVPRPTSC